VSGGGKANRAFGLAGKLFSMHFGDFIVCFVWLLRARSFLLPTLNLIPSMRAHYKKERFLMGKGNKKQVTIGNFPLLYRISRVPINSMVARAFFEVCY
jgi:hypothetical protein